MHLYFLTRGVKHEIDKFITELQGKYVPYRYPDKDKNLVDKVLQLGVRPIQLWELTFPEDQKDIILTTVLSHEQAGQKEQTQHKKHKIWIKMFRKVLGIKPLPKYKTDKRLPNSREHMETVGIGIKPDYWVHAKTGERIYNPTDEQKKECWEGI